MTVPSNASPLARALASLRRGSNFTRGVAVLSLAMAASQGLVVLASPLVTRLYDPEDFGVFAIYASLVAVGSVVASLRYELAIPLPEEEDTAMNLLVLSLVSALGTSGLVAAIVPIFGSDLARLTGVPSLAPYIWLLPVSLFGAATYQALTYWTLRHEGFGTLARTRLMQSGSQVATQLGVGALTRGPIGLLLGDLVGRTGGSGTLALQALRKMRLGRVTRAGILAGARTYRRFPLLSTGSGLLNSLGLQAPVVLLAALYGPRVAGWFALTQRVMALPLTSVGQAFAQVYLSSAAKSARTDISGLRNLFAKSAVRLAKIGTVPILVLGMLAPWLFPVLFGPAWEEAGTYVRIMAPMFAVQFVAVPLSQTLNVLERQGLQLAWDAGRCILVVAALLVPRLMNVGDVGAITAYSVSMLIAYVFLLAMSLSAVRSRFPGDAVIQE